MEFNKEQLKEKLTPLQYHVTQEAGTERPFTGKYNKHYEKGTYVCVVCRQELFSSDTKYDSHCGWPGEYGILARIVMLKVWCDILLCDMTLEHVVQHFECCETF